MRGSKCSLKFLPSSSPATVIRMASSRVSRSRSTALQWSSTGSSSQPARHAKEFARKANRLVGRRPSQVLPQLRRARRLRHRTPGRLENSATLGSSVLCATVRRRHRCRLRLYILAALSGRPDSSVVALSPKGNITMRKRLEGDKSAIAWPRSKTPRLVTGHACIEPQSLRATSCLVPTPAVGRLCLAQSPSRQPIHNGP